MDLTIKEMQEWDKEFSKKKRLPAHSAKPKEAIRITFLKLVEEIGELAESLLRDKKEEAMLELADVMIFVSKLGRIFEQEYHQTSLSKIIKKKMEYSEKREYNRKERKLTKPEKFKIRK